MSEELDITIAYQKVTELMSNYRETLLTLAGSFDKIDVPWNDTENYEYWEDIASSIFDGVVTYTLEKYFSDGQNFDQRMTKYAFYYKDYSNKSFPGSLSRPGDSRYRPTGRSKYYPVYP